MKKGKTLTELAQTLQHIKDTSKDFIVPVSKMSMNQKGEIQFKNGHDRAFVPTKHADGQIAEYTNIPEKYFDRLRSENPALLSENVNHGLGQMSDKKRRDGKPESRMIRTCDGKARAMLSSSYRRLDGFDLCNEILPIMVDKGMEVVSSEITEKRLYIKALSPKITAEVKKGDVVQYGLMISNSDVGSGSVRVEPLIYRLVCLNGMISNTALKKFHVGRNQAEQDVMELLSEETLNMTDAAFWAQVRDVTLSSMREDIFEREVNRLREAANQPIKNFDIPEVVELAMKSTGIHGDAKKDTMVAYLANGADGAGLTRWGLANAFTYAAQGEKISYEDSIELERAGSSVISLHENVWRKIAAS